MPAAMELYTSAQRVYKKTVGGNVHCPLVHCHEGHCTPSVQGTAGLPSMCTQLVGDVQGAPPYSCTDPYSGCTKIALIAESSPLSGALPSE